eukprot:4233372-Lingulodinium_polyedra.AAC.1
MGAVFTCQWQSALQAPCITATGLEPDCKAALEAAGVDMRMPYVARATDLIGEVLAQPEVKKEPRDIS